uniref:Uncharacterized protein n=1 Tax=Cyprinodon variegatus TaxID=28743 RepID=A0A3Q2GMC8_CYPVA
RPPAALQPAARLTCPGLSSSHDPGVCPRDQGLHLRPSELLKFLPSWEGLMEMLDQSLEGSVRRSCGDGRAVCSHHHQRPSGCVRRPRRSVPVPDGEQWRTGEAPPRVPTLP